MRCSAGMKGCSVVDRLDGCAALKLMCCEVQHEHWPCLGQCFGQLASRDSTLAWLEVGVLRGAA